MRPKTGALRKIGRVNKDPGAEHNVDVDEYRRGQ